MRIRSLLFATLLPSLIPAAVSAAVCSEKHYIVVKRSSGLHLQELRIKTSEGYQDIRLNPNAGSQRLTLPRDLVRQGLIMGLQGLKTSGETKIWEKGGETFTESAARCGGSSIRWPLTIELF